jgi:hypothetical protein
VIADGQHQQVLRHRHGFGVGFALRYAVSEVRKGDDISDSFAIWLEQCKIAFHLRSYIFGPRFGPRELSLGGRFPECRATGKGK